MTVSLQHRVAALVACCAVCFGAFANAAEKKDIVDTAVEAGSFKTLAAALGAADLVDALKGTGPFTVFAPTDEAFAKLPAGTVESLLKPENKSQLATILKYHVVLGRVYSEAALAAKQAKTLAGDPVQIGLIGDQARVNDANLIATDLDASNGVIHVIDSVLLPPEKKKVSAAEARKLIEQTVAHGAKTFNAGHHKACAALYMATMREMIESGDQMPEEIIASMKQVLAKAEQTHSPTHRAWTLRHGLDHAYSRMLSLQ